MVEADNLFLRPLGEPGYHATDRRQACHLWRISPMQSSQLDDTRPLPRGVRSTSSRQPHARVSGLPPPVRLRRPPPPCRTLDRSTATPVTTASCRAASPVMSRPHWSHSSSSFSIKSCTPSATCSLLHGRPDLGMQHSDLPLNTWRKQAAELLFNRTRASNTSNRVIIPRRNTPTGATLSGYNHLCTRFPHTMDLFAF